MKLFPPLIEYAICGTNESSNTQNKQNKIVEPLIQRLFESFLCSENEIKESFIEFLLEKFEKNPLVKAALDEDRTDGWYFQREYTTTKGRPDFMLLSKHCVPILAIELKWNANAEREQIERYLSSHGVKGVLLLSRRKSQYKEDKKKPPLDDFMFIHILYSELNEWIEKRFLNINREKRDQIDSLNMHRYANLLTLYSLGDSFSKEEAKKWIATQAYHVVTQLIRTHNTNEHRNPNWKLHSKTGQKDVTQIQTLIDHESVEMVFCLTREIPSWSEALIAVGLHITKKGFEVITKLITNIGSYDAPTRLPKDIAETRLGKLAQKGKIISKLDVFTYRSEYSFSLGLHRNMKDRAWTNVSCPDIASFLYEELNKAVNEAEKLISSDNLDRS